MAVSKPAVPASADSVMRLSRAFMESRVLLTAAELDLFTELTREPQSATALAEARGWEPRPLALVLDALVAMELLSKQDGVYRCAPAVGEQLSSSSPTSVLASVQHAAALWDRWSPLTARKCSPLSLRGDSRGPVRPYLTICMTPPTSNHS